MARDKRKGLRAAYKKSGPLYRFTIKIAIVSMVLGVIYFLFSIVIGPTKTDLRLAQADRDRKSQKELKRLDEVEKKISTGMEGIHVGGENFSSQSKTSLYEIERNAPDVILTPEQEFFRIFIGVNLDREGAKLYIDRQFRGTVSDSFDIIKGRHELKLVYKNPNNTTWIKIDSVYIKNNKPIFINSSHWIEK